MQHNQARNLDPAAPRELAESLHAEVPPLPSYLVDTYSWAYLRPRSLHLLDRHLVVNGILWGNYHALVRAACREFAKGDHVLQAASVYGNLSSRLATQVGADGFLDVIDVAPVQVAHCRRKLAGHANVRVRVADAAVPDRVGYDAACCFFLLHEVPDVQKRQIINALLAAASADPRECVTTCSTTRPASSIPRLHASSPSAARGSAAVAGVSRRHVFVGLPAPAQPAPAGPAPGGQRHPLGQLPCAGARGMPGIFEGRPRAAGGERLRQSLEPARHAGRRRGFPRHHRRRPGAGRALPPQARGARQRAGARCGRGDSRTRSGTTRRAVSSCCTRSRTCRSARSSTRCSRP